MTKKLMTKDIKNPDTPVMFKSARTNKNHFSEVGEGPIFGSESVTRCICKPRLNSGIFTMNKANEARI